MSKSSGPYSWSGDETKSLILARQKFDSLFTGKKGMGLEGWKKISKEISVPVNKCILKWKSLMKTYRNLLKEEDPHESWKYFNMMDSLLNKKSAVAASKCEIVLSPADSNSHSVIHNELLSKGEPRVVLKRLNGLEIKSKELSAKSSCNSPDIQAPKPIVETSKEPSLEELASTAALIDSIVETPLAASIKSYPSFQVDKVPFSFVESCTSNDESEGADTNLEQSPIVSSFPVRKPTSSITGRKKMKTNFKKRKREVPFETVLLKLVRRIKRDLKEQARVRLKLVKLIQALLDKLESEEELGRTAGNSNGKE